MTLQPLKRSKIISFIVLFVFLQSATLLAQPYANPLDIPPILSGNFGELRNNHFHSGIDFKTQQVENKPIFAIADGYVSRINVSPGGYGLALYIDHPATGHTSVYAHLNRFSDEIAQYVKQQQYLQESYRVELYPEKGKFSVKKGERIAWSGNTGSSGGPHLHFEIRVTQTQDPIDPLLFYGGIMTDTQAPDLRGVAIYPVAGNGSVNGSSNPLRITVRKTKTGALQPIAQTVRAWGRIGFAVKAYDRMNGQQNIYGVKHIRLFVDNKQIFSSSINRFSFSKTRMLNSLIDFADWRLNGSFFMQSFIEPGNTLPFYNTENQGYVDILEERKYLVRYELEDFFGNKTSYSFAVQGEKQSFATEDKCDQFMLWSINNMYIDLDVTLDIPQGNLYKSICYQHKKMISPKYFSNIHLVNNSLPIPLHGEATLWLKQTKDWQNKKQLGIVEIAKNGKSSWLGGNYKKDGLETTIRELGKQYAIDIDTIAPIITPLEPANWVKKRQIRFRLKDDKSGIAHFRGTINDKFVLFSHDMKSSVYTFDFDNERPTRDTQQNFVFTATDAAGNETKYQYSFTY